MLENIINYEADDFSEKPLGWSKFASIHELKKFGFVSQDGSDTVTIRLFARRESYAEKTKDLKKYNKHLMSLL